MSVRLTGIMIVINIIILCVGKLKTISTMLYQLNTNKHLESNLRQSLEFGQTAMTNGHTPLIIETCVAQQKLSYLEILLTIAYQRKFLPSEMRVNLTITRQLIIEYILTSQNIGGRALRTIGLNMITMLVSCIRMVLLTTTRCSIVQKV